MFNYYYIIGAFPPIVLGQKREMHYEEARQMVALNVSTADWKQVVLFQFLVDIRNIRALWLHEPLDPRGNWKEQELEEALLVRDALPPFVVAFLDRYESQEERLRFFPALVAAMYREMAPHLSGFLLHYYRLEREMLLVLTALRAKMARKNLSRELQFEDPSDLFVAELLEPSEEADIALPENYGDLKKVFLENKSEPKRLYRATLQASCLRIEELEADHPFAMDQVLGYLARLAIVEAWDRLDEERGRAAVQEVCRSIA